MVRPTGLEPVSPLCRIRSCHIDMPHYRFTSPAVIAVRECFAWNFSKPNDDLPSNPEIPSTGPPVAPEGNPMTRSFLVLAVLAAISIPASAQIRKADPPTELQRAREPQGLVRATPTPSPSPSASPTPLVIYGGQPTTLIDPCKKFICPDPTPAPRNCDPAAFALAWQAFIDSPAPVPAEPVCFTGHPTILCASLQRSADRAAEEAAEQEYKRRFDEVNAHAARCRG